MLYTNTGDPDEQGCIVWCAFYIAVFSYSVQIVSRAEFGFSMHMFIFHVMRPQATAHMSFRI